MKLVDADLLLYAVDADARHHEAAKRWLRATVVTFDSDFGRFTGVDRMRPE